VDLIGVSLAFSGSYSPVVGDTFTVVKNSGSQPVIGTFTGLPEGAVIPDFLGSGLDATITYLGGEGNDVVLDVHPIGWLEVQLVAVAVPSEVGSDVMPSGVDKVSRGATYYVEVWVQDQTLLASGIAGGQVNMSYTTAVTEALDVINLDFDLVPYGSIDNENGIVLDLGGGTLVGGRGVAPQWTRLAYVEISAAGLGEATFQLSPGTLEFSRFGAGQVDWDLVDLGMPIVVDQIGGTRIDMTIVGMPSTTSGSGEVAALPDSAGWVHEWEPFWVEIWVGTPDSTTSGVAAATVDLRYDTGYLSALEIEYGPAFTQNRTGTIDDSLGVVSAIGGSTQLTDVGDDAYVLLARVRFTSTDDDRVPVDQVGRNIGPYDMQLALAGGQTELVGAGSVVPVLGAAPETELWAVVYDIDDNNRIDFGDFSYFAAAFGQTVEPSGSEPPYVWWADFDQSGLVDFGDLSFLAPNFAASRAQVQSGAKTLDFPPNFPAAWRAVPEPPGGEGEARGGDTVQQSPFAGAGMLAGDDRPQAGTDATFAQLGRLDDVDASLRGPTGLPDNRRVADFGHGSSRPRATEFPGIPGISPSDRASAAVPTLFFPTITQRIAPFEEGKAGIVEDAQATHRWSGRWEPLDDILSLLAEPPSDALRGDMVDPHDAVFAGMARFRRSVP
jgi:hypothetical protein